MDLNDFPPNILPELASAETVQNLSFKEALQYTDQTWSINLGKAARWMDLVGDYAGSEPYVVDGESLLRLTLSDPLLALGQADDPSFQILHAYHSLERFLRNLIIRSANFDVVFWRDNRCGTLRIGDSQYVVASRILARGLLVRHLQKLSEDHEFKVKLFEGLTDPSWTQYEMMKKPMFVMTDNGGAIPEDASSSVYAHTLLQRVFVYDLLSQGLSMASLFDLEFRDSKMLSFVHEAIDTCRSDLSHVWDIAIQKRLAFNEELSSVYPDASLEPNLRSAHTIIGVIGRELLDASLPNLPAYLLESLTYLYLSHLVLLEGLPIELRARSVEVLHPELKKLVVDVFLPRAYMVSATVLSRSDETLDMDGRFFVSLLQFSCTPEGPATILKHSSVNQIWAGIRDVPPDFGVLAPFYQSPSSGLSLRDVSDPSFSLLPFSNVVLDSHLSSVQVTALDNENWETPVQGGFSSSTPFSDTTHWHNSKSLLPPHLGGEKPKFVDERQRQRYLKNDQRFMASMQKQAVTSSGISGRILEQIVIPPVGSSQPKQKQSYPPLVDKVKTPKAQKLSSVELLRQKIKEEKESKGKSSSSTWWREQLAIMEKTDVSGQIKHVEGISSAKVKENQVGTEVAVYRLHLELIKWVAEPDRDSSAVNDCYSVSVMKMVRDMSKKYLTPTVSKHLARVLRALGFDDYVSALTAITESEDSPLSFTFIKLFSSKGQIPKYDWMKIREDPIEWQLRLFGEFMDRSMDSASDSRVSFDPDAWQRKVLDCIDRSSSLLVVAPTSAGKTFISFYAMEQVLRESDEGIFVYVAPTKALAMQIAAEVYARFSKNLKNRNCWALYTRDYRVHDPQNCQILVTVPEILSIMLLSPALAKQWTPRLKWICLDEIHSIGQQEGGAIWEQLVLMAPCPIIGLSATVGDPKNFSDWLAAVQESHGFEYQFIQHPHRYSHLRKFFYLLQQNDQVKPFGDLSSHKQTGRACFIHPITSLSFGASTIPEDLALEAADTLTLYQALKAVCASDIESLNPRKFFSSTQGKLLTQKDVLGYEASLKDVVKDLATTNNGLVPVSSLKKVINELQDPSLKSEHNLQTIPSPRKFYGNLIFLLADLHASGDMPAILFNFDRSGCENMAIVITETLAESEKEWRAQSSEWDRKLREWHKWKEQEKYRERAAVKLAKQRKDPDERHDNNIAGTSWHSSFDPKDPSEQYSFANYRVYSKSELDEDIRCLESYVPSWTLPALRRGIAVHHAGMNKHYRSLIEGLLRRGFLRVVIAAGTLAVGINAPAKTSVFCGDSPFLTALMYRQCAGRAGRRGYDTLGKVVFYGLSMDRVQRLILSRLPSLQGHFPLTSTLVLRLFSLLHGSDYAEVSTRTVNNIMSLSQISLRSNIGQQQLLHHLRFSIEYLRRARLLDKEGRPMNLFAVAAHLYYTEPSNLALVALMRNGILHQLSRKNDVDARREFMLLMAHLFGRRYLTKTFANPQNLDTLRKKYPSQIILPPMDPDAKRVLVEHEKQSLQIYNEYARTYAKQYADKLDKDCRLPLSRLDYSGSSDTVLAPLLHRYLKSTANRVMTRSAFVANSGHVDVFQNILELTSTVKEGLHLHQYAVPSFAELIAEGDGEKTLNAYLFDFYMHGQTKTLAEANGIRPGDIWYLLQEFSLTLRTLRTALEQLLTKISKEYGSTDTAEKEQHVTIDYAEAEFNKNAGAEEFKCPKGVAKEDWRVYKVVRDASAEFEVKYKAMWA